jgi:hypothetical protein
MTMASKCKNTGKQVRGPSISWSDNDEPVLYSSPIHTDSSKCNSQKDWICSRVLPDEPIESMEFPYAGSRLKNPESLTLFRYKLTLSLLVQATKLSFLPKDVV